MQWDAHVHRCRCQNEFTKFVHGRLFERVEQTLVFVIHLTFRFVRCIPTLFTYSVCGRLYLSQYISHRHTTFDMATTTTTTKKFMKDKKRRRCLSTLCVPKGHWLRFQCVMCVCGSATFRTNALHHFVYAASHCTMALSVERLYGTEYWNTWTVSFRSFLEDETLLSLDFCRLRHTHMTRDYMRYMTVWPYDNRVKWWFMVNIA